MFSLLFSCSVMSNFCDPMDFSTPGVPVHHQLPEVAQNHVHWLVMLRNHLTLYCPLHLPSIFPSSGSFLMSLLFESGGQSIAASASVLPMTIQSWFPLGLTDLTFLSKRYSRVFSNNHSSNATILWLSVSLRSKSHICPSLLYLKWITNKNLLYSTWNSVQCYMWAWTLFIGYTTI